MSARNSTLAKSQSADTLSAKSTDQGSLSLQLTVGHIPAPTSKPSAPAQKQSASNSRRGKKFVGKTDFGNRSWRVSTGILSCLVNHSEMFNVSCSAVKGGEVFGLCVMFRNAEVTDQLTPSEIEAMKLLLLENFKLRGALE